MNIVESIENRKIELVDSMQNFTSEEFNRKLLTRQAIILEFLIQEKYLSELKAFIETNHLLEYYLINKKPGSVKRITVKNLITFGMAELIPRFKELGYELIED